MIGRALDTSVTVRVARPLFAGSAVCRFADAAVAGLRRTGAAIRAGLAGDRPATDAIASDRRIEALVAGSRVASVVHAWSLAPGAACGEARARLVLAPLSDADVRTRVRVWGGMLVVAVATHALWLVALGLPVHAIGWSWRLALAATGLTLIVGPDAVAAAWRQRTAPSPPNG